MYLEKQCVFLSRNSLCSSFFLLSLLYLFAVVKTSQLQCSHNETFDVGALSHFSTCSTATYINFIFSAHEESNDLMSSSQTDLTWDVTIVQ